MAVAPSFSIPDVLQASDELRSVGTSAHSMEEAAGAIIAYLRDRFINKATGQPALPLARFYVTRRCRELEPALQDFARATGADAPIGPDVVCLTLLATVGEEPAWNDRRASVSHKAIPLPSVQALRRSPMIYQLIEQLGLNPRHLVEPDPSLFRDLSARAYNVFFVEEAQDSPYVPAQSGFVIPYGIRSVVGFGGVLPDGVFFSVVLFSALPIPRHAVDAFAAVGLGVKAALLSTPIERVFASDPLRTRGPDAQRLAEVASLEARVTTLTQLLDVRAEVLNREEVRREYEGLSGPTDAAERSVAERSAAMAEARHRAIVEGALDGIIGMDVAGRITDFNRAAETMFGFAREDVIGEALADVIIPYSMRDRHRRGLVRLLETGVGPIIGRRIEVNALRSDGTEFPVELAVTEVADHEPRLFNGYVRDITPTREALAELQAGQERLARIARTLQTSLLPPSLPDIPGVELAAAFAALGEGYDVGGDFYDAFELDNGKWALVLGDVCGKGSDAAALTALGRYTLRSAALREDDPTGVLAELNTAIHRQRPGLFCTCAYATLDPSSGALEVALGGHPHPILLRSSGEAIEVGRTALLLGPFPHWQGTTDRVVLEPGDSLFFFSDGAVEARTGGEVFGLERLVAAIRSAGPLQIDAAVQEIEADILSFAGTLSDDLAILALRRDSD